MTAEMRKMEAALAVVRDSEKLLVNLRFSISSRSLRRDLGISGLGFYLKSTRRNLRVQFFHFAIRALWGRICRKLKAGN